MNRAVELATVLGAGAVDEALGLAALAGRFGDQDLPQILNHLAAHKCVGELVHADETHSVQPGTGGWQALGRVNTGHRPDTPDHPTPTNG